MPTLNAVLSGYQEHLFDLKCLAVVQGFWAGYYSSSKKSKSVNSVLKTLMQEHKKQKRKITNVNKPEVDLDKFLKREQKLKAFLERGGSNG